MSKGRLLLADDSITIQKVVNLTFADEGIDVVTVGDGDAAIGKIAESRPDIVLADVHMPGLTGYEVCEHIRANPETRDTPVILLVGSFEPFDEGEAARVGANAYLTKPFQSIRQLVAQVSELIEARDEHEVTPTPPVAAPESEPHPEHNGHEEERLSFAAAAEPAVAPVSTPKVSGSRGETTPLTIADIEDLEAASFQGDPDNPEGSEANDIETLYEQSLSDLGADDDIIETSFGVSRDDDATEALPTVSELVDIAEHRTEEMHFAPDQVQTSGSSQTETVSKHFAFEPAEDGPAGGTNSPEGLLPQGEHEEPVHGELDQAPYFTGTETPTAMLTPPEEVALQADQPPMAEGAAFEEPPRRIGEETIPMASRFDRTLSQPFKFDDLDLLDLSAPEAAVEITSPSDANDRGASQQLVTLSPELIEMIAQRVVEKLSEKY